MRLFTVAASQRKCVLAEREDGTASPDSAVLLFVHLISARAKWKCQNPNMTFAGSCFLNPVHPQNSLFVGQLSGCTEQPHLPVSYFSLHQWLFHRQASVSKTKCCLGVSVTCFDPFLFQRTGSWVPDSVLVSLRVVTADSFRQQCL